MKRIDLVRHLEEFGCEFVREGKQHTLYINRWQLGERDLRLQFQTY